MKIEIEIDDDIIRDAIGRAKIDYWTRETRWSDRQNLAIVIVEDEPDKGSDGRHLLMRGDFERGVAVLAEKYPHVFKDLIAQTGDMYTGDLLIQCAAFGEEKYA